MMIPVKFLISGQLGHTPAFVEMRRQDPEAWAVTCFGACLNKSGRWEHEPMPSSRSEAFFARTRWATAEEAKEAFAVSRESDHP